MSNGPIRDPLADAIRHPALWTTTFKEEVALARVVVDLSDERPIHLICGLVTINFTEDGADGMIDELRKAVCMVRAASAP